MPQLEYRADGLLEGARNDFTRLILQQDREVLPVHSEGDVEGGRPEITTCSICQPDLHFDSVAFVCSGLPQPLDSGEGGLVQVGVAGDQVGVEFRTPELVAKQVEPNVICHAADLTTHGGRIAPGSRAWRIRRLNRRAIHCEFGCLQTPSRIGRIDCFPDLVGLVRLKYHLFATLNLRSEGHQLRLTQRYWPALLPKDRIIACSELRVAAHCGC